MELPGTLYQLIGEFVINFPKKKDSYHQDKHKRKFANSILASFPEYCDELYKSFNLTELKDLNLHIDKVKQSLMADAEERIDKFNLEEYRDIIMEHYVLTTSDLCTIAKYVYDNTHDIYKTCEVYGQLGYTGFKDRHGNENYLIILIKNWIVFAQSKGYSHNKAQHILFLSFLRIDDLDADDNDCIETYDIRRLFLIEKVLTSFEPQSVEFNNRLIDSIIERWEFNTPFELKFDEELQIEVSDEEDSNLYYLCTASIDGIKRDFTIKKSSYGNPEALKEELDFTCYRYKDIPYAKKYRFGLDGDYCNESLILFFYTYIFNKANDETPYCLFAICIFAKWLNVNIKTLKKFLPELSENSLKSVLMDFAIEKYNSLKPVCPEENLFEFYMHPSKEEESITNLIYDLKEQREISNRELTDFWKHIVIDSEMSYSKDFLKDANPYLRVAEKPYPESGEFLLPWKYVRYSNGRVFFYHPYHEKGKNAILPYIHLSEISLKDFSDLSKNIVWNLPPIKCKSENGKITWIDADYADYNLSAIAEINKVIKRRSENHVSRGWTAKDILVKYKSEQLTFLKTKQLQHYPIIPVIEIACNSDFTREEPALLFTVAKTQDTITLVYENTSLSRASYIFIIKKELYNSAIKKIIEFFTSGKMNKRSELQFSRDMFTKEDGFLRCIRILHNDTDDWKSAIYFYAKS